MARFKRVHPNPKKSMKHGIRNGHTHAGIRAGDKRRDLIAMTHGAHQAGVIHGG